MAICRTKAFVLKKDDFRETSLIAHFFTEDYGKLSCLFKGIRKEPEKFATNLELFSLNEIIFYKNDKNDLHLASQCDCLDNYDSLRFDMNKVYACSFMLALINCLIQQEQVCRSIFTLFKECLKFMEQTQDYEKLLFIFKIKILSISGFEPHIDSCVVCSNQIDYNEKAYFSSSRGGLLCQNCLNVDKASRLIYRGTIASLSYIQKNEIESNLRLGLNALIKKELFILLNKFLEYHLERQLKSFSCVQNPEIPR